MSPPEISIVIPAYNEADRLPGYLRVVVTFLDARAESSLTGKYVV